MSKNVSSRLQIWKT